MMPARDDSPRLDMTLERIVIAVGLVAGLLLTVSLLVMAISALPPWVAIVVLFGVTMISLVLQSLLRRRVKGGTVIEIDLEGGVVETSGSDPITRAITRRSVTTRDFADALERGAEDARVVGLVVRLGNGGIDIGNAQELRDAVHRFRQSGKKAVAFSEAFGETRNATADYYLAAAFSEIFLQPNGSVSIEGMVARSTFLRGLFDKFGLVPDFDHRKEYKAAKYRLTETQFTEPHREALAGVARDLFSQVVDGIAADRGLDRSRVEEVIDSAPLTPDEALEAGLIDHIAYRNQAYESAGGRSRFMLHDRYLKKAGRPHRKGEQIALIYGTGSIARGGPRFDPLTGGPSFAADVVAQAFREAIDDDKVKAIVFRVDSPGGSAVASEVVYHEVARAREAKKAVVVSMGNVAASGGYWVSAGADKIVALPGTVTGSIGVVFGKLANREAWSRLGITFDQIAFGRNATFGTSQDVYTDTERERIEVIIDDIYDGFVTRVAAGRDLTPDQVEQIAKGRIWTGAQAHEHGLVDEIGGLARAIDLAKSMAGIDRHKPVRLVILPSQRSLPIPERKDSSEPIGVLVATVLDAIAGVRDSISGTRVRAPWTKFR